MSRRSRRRGPSKDLGEQSNEFSTVENERPYTNDRGLATKLDSVSDGSSTPLTSTRSLDGDKRRRGEHGDSEINVERPSKSVKRSQPSNDPLAHKEASAKDPGAVPQHESVPASSHHSKGGKSRSSEEAAQKSKKSRKNKTRLPDEDRPVNRPALPFNTKQIIRESTADFTRVARKWIEPGREYRTGKFSSYENKLIREAMMSYVRDHGLTDDAMQKLCQIGKNRELRGAWLEIAECLPDRSVRAIHAHASQLFRKDVVNGKWEAKDVEKLLSMVKTYGRRWVMIGEALQRTPTSVRDKYKECSERDRKVGERWTNAEVETLLRLVNENRSADGTISWGPVSAALPGRTVTDARCKWRQYRSSEKHNGIAQAVLREALDDRAHPGAEGPDGRSGVSQMSKDGKGDAAARKSVSRRRVVAAVKDLMLLRELFVSEAEDESEVTWSKLSHPTARVRWGKLRKMVPKDFSFNEAVEKLYKDMKKICEEDGITLDDENEVERLSEAMPLEIAAV